LAAEAAAGAAHDDPGRRPLQASRPDERDPAALAATLLAEATGVHLADPLFAFEAYLLHLRERSERIVVVIEALDSLPPETARWLLATIENSRGALRALAPAADERTAARGAARLGLTLRVARPAAPEAPRRARVPRRIWLLCGALGLLALLLSVPL
jgi:hypothetical protein